MFGRGRYLRTALALWVAALCFSFAFWYAALDFARGSVVVQELVGVTFAVLASACISPRMPSWEQLARVEIHRLAALLSLGVLVATTSTPLLIHQLVTWLPRELVPRAGVYDPTGYDLGQLDPLMTNLALMGAVVLLLTAVMGQARGALTSVAVYVALLYGSYRGNPWVPFAFYGVQLEPPFQEGWAAGLGLLAVTAWYRTTGARMEDL